jgi:hypothetical protein
LKGKPGQGDNLGQKQEITPRQRGIEVSLLKVKPRQGENLGQKQEITPR